MILYAIIIALTLVLGLQNTVMRWRLKHMYKMPTGNFKIKVKSSEWVRQTQNGVFAIAMTDSQTKQVVFTLLIERGDE